MKTAIYMRISTEKHQDTALQEQAIMKFLQYKDIPMAINYCDRGCTGSNKDRSDLNNLLIAVKAGTIERIVVWKLDRLSRSLSDLLDLIKLFKQHNVALVSVSEDVDFGTPIGRTMMQILGAFGELERNIIVERTIAGMAAKKAKGLHMGRRSALTIEMSNKIKELSKSGLTYKAICRQTGVSRGKVIYAIKKENL